MSYPVRKSFIHVASILIVGLVLVGCQGGGDSGSGSGSGGDTPDQQTASLTPDSALLSWEYPEKRENGDDFHFSEVDHYVVSWGQDPDNLSNTTEVNCSNCVDVEYEIEDLGEGTWYFTVQTRDTEGNLSRKADLASKRI